jgi:malonyl-CoA decarboxylase
MAGTLNLSGLLRFSSSRDESLTRAARRDAAKAIALCRALLSEGGEAASTRLAAEVLGLYHSFEQRARDTFFDLLAAEFSPNPEKIFAAADAYKKDTTPHNLQRLWRSVEAPRQELFRRLNTVPGGTKALVRMRAQLLQTLSRNAQWEPIATDLSHLLTSWFNRGFLVLQRIDWHTPAVILEKLIEYEAVHQIQGWDDLRRRLERDRRCYGFFHPALPDEPLIFIEVALTRGMSSRVQPLLDPQAPVADPASADHAMFYSITNCQEGLRGVAFGSFLIKQVVEDLRGSFPRLRRFATVSPVPGFRKWLLRNLTHLESLPKFAKLTGLAPRLEEATWFKNDELTSELRGLLVPLCAYYLLHAKHDAEPLDPVARFHLKNGASLEHIHWLGDTSDSGRERSAGLMTNYVYQLAEVEGNHERYVKEHEIAASRDVKALAKQVISGAKTAGVQLPVS